MFKSILFIIIALFVYSCDNGNPMNPDGETIDSSSWFFIANEGNFGSTNGSVSMISDQGEVFTTDFLGQTVQSLEVYNDKLIVLINGSSEMKIFDITSEGLSMPGITIDLEGSSPREMVIVNDKVYFTNWNSQDIKIFNLFNYVLEDPIYVGSSLEGIIEKDGSLWVALNMENTTTWAPDSYIKQYDRYLYKLRHLVENVFLYLKRWRGITTRYAKNSASFAAAVQIRCISLWASIL